MTGFLKRFTVLFSICNLVFGMIYVQDVSESQDTVYFVGASIAPILFYIALLLKDIKDKMNQ